MTGVRVLPLVVAVACCLAPVGGAVAESAGVDAFLRSHCLDCHQGKTAEAGLDLGALSRDVTDSNESKWVRIFDRVEAGEMPPKSEPRPAKDAVAAFLKTTSERLTTFRKNENSRVGRVRGRRLTSRQVERSLQDLLLVDIPLVQLLAEEPPGEQFSTVVERQAISHFHLEQHLAAVDKALDDAFARALRDVEPIARDLDAEGVARQDANRRCRDPEMREGQAVVWSSGLIFYGRISATEAPESGWYRFTARVSGLKPPETGGVWATIRTGLCVSSAPLLSWVRSFEATKEPKEITFEAWLPKGEMLEIRPGDSTLKRGKFNGGQVGTGEGEPQNLPGIAIDHLTMERFYRHSAEEIRQRLFGNLELRAENRGFHRVASRHPEEDIEQLLTAFASRAFRRPVTAEEMQPFVSLAKESWKDGHDVTVALRVGYRSILCSPRFLYFTEAPGALDDFAVATRLSYFLTGTTPDDALLSLAAAGKLKNATELKKQTDRLLAKAGGRFVSDLTDEWLDLDQIDFTDPDAKLFPGFDSIVQDAMLQETRLTVDTMLRENQSVTQLIDSNKTWLNSRLARYYGIDGVEGDEMRRVELKPEDHRGGVLTQGAILKVTANGSNTSPVVRGVWVSERLLGVPIPPPPSNVPAIEPDIRGARTIREILAKHRSQDSCATCHVKIDPPGFALENFDPSGRWRDRYMQLIDGKRERGVTVDASYTLADGREFKSVDDFRKLICSDGQKLAANVAEKLLTYGTGAPMSFADRSVVDDIARKSADDGYGFRTILYCVVTSPVFLSK